MGNSNYTNCRSIKEKAACDDALTSDCYWDPVDGCYRDSFRQDQMANVAERVARAVDGNKFDQEYLPKIPV